MLIHMVCPECEFEYQVDHTANTSCPECFTTGQEMPAPLPPSSYSTFSHEDKMRALNNIFSQCTEIADAKGRDYSGITDSMSNFRDFGTLGIVVRLGDKYHRSKNLVTSKYQHVKDESLRNTLLDMVNYSALAIIMLDQETSQKVKD